LPVAAKEEDSSMPKQTEPFIAPQTEKGILKRPFIFLVLLLTCLCLGGACQKTYTIVNPFEELGFQEIIDKHTIWNLGNSPYIIHQNIFIIPEATLVIEPGVQIQLGPGANIFCQGRIVAKGEPKRPILIRGLEKAPWGKIDCFGGRLGDKGRVPINIFKHCIVEGGHGIVARASAVYVESCMFKNNVSTPIRLEFSSGEILHNEIHHNSTELEPASGNGGGIMVYTDKEVLVAQNDIHDNVSSGGRDGGGGVYAYAYDCGKVSIKQNSLYSNSSDRFGGGLVAYSCHVEKNVIFENTAKDSGGGIYAIGATLKDNRVEKNRAKRGGGIYAENTQLQLNEVSDNTAPFAMGGGLFFYGEGTIENNTFFRNGSQGDQPGEAILVSGNPVLKHNNIVQSVGHALRVQTHSLTPDLDATENFWGTQDPEAICTLIYDWLDDSEVGLVNWKSYATGWVKETPSLPAGLRDLQGYQTDIPDTMPFPKPPGQLKGPIDEDQTLGKPGGMIYKVTRNILIPEGVVVKILPGTVFEISPGVTFRVRGTLIAEGEKKRPIRFTGDPNMPWGRLFFETVTAVDDKSSGHEWSERGSLRYCVIEYGHGILMEEIGPLIAESVIRLNYGSGITIRNASVRILKNRIEENQTRSNGGGIYAYGSKFIQIAKNEILNNRANEDGGGVFAYGYRSTTAVNLSDNRIHGNQCSGDGAGVWVSRSSVIDNRIISNRAEGKGGGLFATFALVEGNEIAENSAYQGGGVYAETNSSLEGNRIIGNSGLDAFGGAVFMNFWGMSIKNEVFRKNLVTRNRAASPTDNGGIYLNGSMVFEYNQIYGNNGSQLYNANPADRPPLSAPHCYWGTNQEAEIEAAVHDGSDDPGLARVLFTPFARNAKGM
jgi:parallel beta-helix repeat protein/predicted outer membrane repeat protein